MNIETAKATPPLAVSAISLLGIQLNEWVFILTIIYVTLQITFIVRDKLVKPWMHKRANKSSSNLQKGKPQP